MDQVKIYFRNTQFKEAKECLIAIIDNSVKNDPFLLSKLADIYVQLEDNENSLKSYASAVKYIENENKTKNDQIQGEGDVMSKKISNIYSKYAYQLQINGQLSLAQHMFLKALSFNTDNDHCLFQYGLFLMDKMHSYSNALNKFQQCLQINPNRACVHYRIGILLLTYIKLPLLAKHHLQMAIQLKPDIAKYHQHMDICVKQLQKMEESKEEKEHEECKSNNILEENCRKVEELAIENVDNCSILISNESRMLVRTEESKEKNDNPMICVSAASRNSYNNNQESINQNSCAIESELNSNCKWKLIVYDFDLTVTYWRIFDARKNFDRYQFLNTFGGCDRIKRIDEHFERILATNINIAIISSSLSSNIMNNALKKVYLLQRLKNSVVIGNVRNIALQINLFQSKLHINDPIAETLFVSSDENILNAMMGCETIHVHEKQGLTIKQLEYIENNAGCGHHFITEPSFVIPPLYGEEKQIFNSIIYQVNKTDLNGGCSHEDLGVVQWMKNHWVDDEHPYLLQFLSFARLMLIAKRYQARTQCWSAMNLLRQLLKWKPDCAMVMCMLAFCLCKLKNYEESEVLFKRSIAIDDHFVTKTQYGLMLFYEDRFEEAEQMFLQSLAGHEQNSKAILGYARTLREMNQMDKAEHYYLKSVDLNPTSDIPRYYYGFFLFRERRFEEARDQLLIAVQHWPHSAQNHIYLAKALFKTKQFDLYEYHITRGLEINPFQTEAKHLYFKYFGYHFQPHQKNMKNYVKEVAKRILNEKTGQYELKKSSVYYNKNNNSNDNNLNKNAKKSNNIIFFEEVKYSFFSSIVLCM